jgi:hypothetical protein
MWSKPPPEPIGGKHDAPRPEADDADKKNSIEQVKYKWNIA